MAFLDVIVDNANEVVFILCGLLGGVAHYLKKYMRKETDVPLSGWFGRANISATIYTFLVFLFAMIGSIASGIVNDSMTVWIAMYVGFVTGFALDAGFNNDGRGTITAADMERGVIHGKPTGMVPGGFGGGRPGSFGGGFGRPGGFGGRSGLEPDDDCDDDRPQGRNERRGKPPLTDLRPNR